VTDFFWQWQAPLPMWFSGAKGNSPFLPIDVFQTKGHHFFGAQAKSRQQQKNGMVAKAFGRVASAAPQQFLYLIDGDLPG
jgi:hypothetical protein